MKRAVAVIAVFSLLFCSSALAVDGENWELTVASWNLLNLSPRKVGLPPHALRTALLDRYASIISQYDIVFIQELLDGNALPPGSPLVTAIAQRAALANYNCQTISNAWGRQGRPERYGVCYATANLALHAPTEFPPQVTALNGTQQPPQNVWMRPPFRVTFVFTPPDGSPPYTFHVYSSHTKPAYGAANRPPGTPANAPNNQSVRNELTSLETNGNFAGNAIVLGDLNADCASYPQHDRGQNFAAAWTWHVNYGEKTNTAPQSSCAYDRLLFNAAMQNRYLEHGIFRTGIDERVDGERVSDHFLVWARVGVRGKKRKLAAATTAPVLSSAKRRFVARRSLRINGQNLQPQKRPKGQPKIVVVAYDPAAWFDGNRRFPIPDVRGAATPVRITGDGALAEDVVWDSPQAGRYNIVLDRDGDGMFDRNADDVANSANEIDLLVVDTPDTHSDVALLGDLPSASERLALEENRNLYVSAQKLPPHSQVDAYVVSTRLLLNNGFTSWAAARAQNLRLDLVSVPLAIQHGPIFLLSVEHKLFPKRLDVADDGTLFATLWPDPSNLFNMRAFQEESTPVFRPEYATDDDNRDPCAQAWRSTDTNFRDVCNSGSMFPDYYGTRFNVVIDVNQNGRFDDGDLVHEHAVSAMHRWFQTHDRLGAGDVGAPVAEYKELLAVRVGADLPQDERFDEKTVIASKQYLCDGAIAQARLTDVAHDALAGFELVPPRNVIADAYLGGIGVGGEIELFKSGVQAGNTACLSGQELVVENFNRPTGGVAFLRADSIRIEGQVHAGAGLSFEAEDSIVFMAGSSIRVRPDLNAGARLIIGNR